MQNPAGIIKLWLNAEYVAK